MANDEDASDSDSDSDSAISDLDIAIVTLKGYCEMAQETLQDLKIQLKEHFDKLESMKKDFFVDPEKLAEGLSAEFQEGLEDD
jgi:hypothetical protein